MGVLWVWAQASERVYLIELQTTAEIPEKMRHNLPPRLWTGTNRLKTVGCLPLVKIIKGELLNLTRCHPLASTTS